MMSSFCRIFGANDQTIFPAINRVKESCLYKILQKNSSSEQVDILYQKGLLDREVLYLTPSQLGGRIGGKAGTRTDAGCESGQHLKDNGELTMPMRERGSLGGKESTRTDAGCESGKHLKDNGEWAMPMRERAKCGEATQIGYSRSGQVYLSIIKVNPTTHEPLETEQNMYATSKTTLAAFLVNSGLISSLKNAMDQMAQHYKAIERMHDENLSVDKSKIIRLTNRNVEGGGTYVKLTKHVEKPSNMIIIPTEILINEGADKRKRFNEYQQRRRKHQKK
jgi:hypothetical protein